MTVSSPSRGPILYLTSCLPKRSETFVYKELLGLRRKGVTVHAASLYAPETGLGDPALDALAGEVITVYAGGFAALLRDAAAGAFRHPARSTAVLVTALKDALSARDVQMAARPKVLIQALAALALAHRLRGLGLVGIHIHMAHAPATVGMYAAQALGIPFSFTGHAVDLFRDRALLEEKLRRATFVACISEWHRDWYRQTVDRPDADYPVIRCGVDVPAAPVPPSPGKPLRVLGLARLVAKKGFDVLLEAVAQAAARGVSIECTLAGDGPERANLEEIARRHGFPVRFLGAVANADVPALLEKTDVMVLPCRVSGDGDRDGIPVALMEAMAAGICVISGDLPTIRELIRDGASGLLVPPGEPAPLADALVRLATDPVLRQALAKEGRNRVQEEFSSEKNLDRIVSVLASHHML
jgi:glycosyltransferase involved in cell wall biosynthesis